MGIWKTIKAAFAPGTSTPPDARRLSAVDELALSASLRALGTSIGVDRQQRVHRACDGDERPANAAGGAKIRKTFADVRYGQSIDIHIIAESGAIGVISRVQSLLPLAHGDLPELEVVDPPQRGQLVSLGGS